MAEYIERVPFESLIEHLDKKEPCKNCHHRAACDAWVRNATTLYDDYDYSVENCPYYVATADVVEVRHGEWNIRSEIHQMFDDVDEELFVECPFCQRRYHVPFEFEDEKILEYAREEYPYCHCGAKMDGKETENET